VRKVRLLLGKYVLINEEGSGEKVKGNGTRKDGLTDLQDRILKKVVDKGWKLRCPNSRKNSRNGSNGGRGRFWHGWWNQTTEE